MDVEIRELTETYAQIVISGATPSLVNAIRRVMISELPKMAIEDVEFHLGSIRDETGREYESISPLFDEIIAHRLGMVPIPTDLELFGFKDECVCNGEGCPNCTIMYSLNKKGPCTVYSGDLEPLGDSRFSIKEDLIPIVKLAEGQALLIYATAVLGMGSEHAKYQSAHSIGYKYYPTVEMNEKICDRGGACIDVCPKNLFIRKRNKVVFDKERLEECTLCKACEEVCELDAIKVTSDDTKFVFRFETDGAMTAEEVFKYSLRLLEDKFTTFREAVSALK